MALVTTFMAAPLLRLLDRDNRYGEPRRGGVRGRPRAHPRATYPDLAVPERSVLVAPQTDAALAQLLALAKPLAASAPPREVILARLVVPPRAAECLGGLQLENAAVAQRLGGGQRGPHRADGQQGIAARAVALTSSSPGSDLSHLVEHENVDLVLVEGRRPLLGQGIALREVTELLTSAPSDVAVLIAREQEPIELGPDKPVLVVFGGAEHDWSALELGSWLASTTGAPLKLIGAGDEQRRRSDSSVSRMLADAGAAGPAVLRRGHRVRSSSRPVARASSTRPRVPGCSSSACRSAGAARASARRARRSPAPSPAPVLFVRRGHPPVGARAPRGPHALPVVDGRDERRRRGQRRRRQWSL